jgi:cellulose synthase A
LLEGSPKIAGDEENNGPDDSDDELNIKYRQDGSSIHQNFAYGSVLFDFDSCFFFIVSLSHLDQILSIFSVMQENGDYNSKQQWRPNGRAFSSTGSVLGKDFEAERDGYTDAEWKERVDKWKARQEKRGLVTKGEQTNEDKEDDEEEYL